MATGIMRATSSKLLGAASISLLCSASALGQAGLPEKRQLAEDVFKNIQVLKGTSVNEFMGIMGFFSASLGLNCTDCHISESSGDWGKYADETARKQTTRRMVQMVKALNQNSFAGRRAVTCYSCHRGSMRPRVIPSLLEQYSAPALDDPNNVEAIAGGSLKESADQILHKFIEALGGAQRLSKIATIAAKGTYQGFDTDLEPSPLEIYAKAPGQRTTIVQLHFGNSITTYDGHNGWISAPDRPAQLIALSGKDGDGVKLEASLSFPGRIKQALSDWRAGFPKTMIDDREVQVIQGTSAGGSRVKLFFDKQSGLLVRAVCYTDTAVGVNPRQTDYSDYREVAGVKMPFRYIVTWTDGQSTLALSEIKPNVAIEASKLAKPAAAPSERPAAK